MTVYKPQRWEMRVTVQPTIEPVTREFVRDHANLSNDDDLQLLQQYIVMARGLVEDSLNRALLTQTRVLRLSGLPLSEFEVIELPGGEIQSVASITYVDVDGVTQTLSASDYAVEQGTGRGTGYVALAMPTSAWPISRVQGALPVTITYTAGWTAASLVPVPIRIAVAQIATDIYNARGTMVASGFEEHPWYKYGAATWKVTKVGVAA